MRKLFRREPARITGASAAAAIVAYSAFTGRGLDEILAQAAAILAAFEYVRTRVTPVAERTIEGARARFTFPADR